MRRISTWEQRLSDYIASKLNEPFEYGVNDCSLFSAGAVEAMTEEDPMPEFRGKYDSLLTSVRVIQDAGFADLEAVIDSKFPEVPIGFAKRGDLAFHDGSVGVIIGNEAVFVSDDGLIRTPRSEWTKTWAVG